jgi:two-component system, OmpR family, sensor histidine kinase TctE
MMKNQFSNSLRKRLLAGIFIPMLVVLLISAYLSYNRALLAANTAYDRTLLASAKTIGESLSIADNGDHDEVQTNFLYSALEPFETDNRSRMVYHVSGLRGEHVTGDIQFPKFSGKISNQTLYAALVDFYDIEYQSEPMRVAVLLQPISGINKVGIATVQVAETLELRHALARDFLRDFLFVQVAATASIAFVVIVVVSLSTRPIKALGIELRQRDEHDLSPIRSMALPLELFPLVDAANQLMARLAKLLDNQKRFVRDTAHQLRTPLAVLRTQVQSAQRGDVSPTQAIEEIELTVQRATLLANQMLDLAKVEQVKNSDSNSLQAWDQIARNVAIDLAPLIAQRGIEFSIETAPINLETHLWMLQELTRNLIHNAITHAPDQSEEKSKFEIKVKLEQQLKNAVLTVSDNGRGIPSEFRDRLFQPFSRGTDSKGSGLGLSICLDICKALNGTLKLENKIAPETGLVAIASIPIKRAKAQN